MHCFGSMRKMNKWISKFLILTTFVKSMSSAPVLAPRKIYHLDKLIRVHPKTADQVLALGRLQDNLPAEIDFWKRPNINTDIDIHVPLKVYDDVIQGLSHADLKPALLVHDVQSVIDQEEASMEIPDYVIDSTGAMVSPALKLRNTDIVGKFARHAEIDSWLSRMASQYTAIARTESIGTSYEGRDMKVIKIGRNLGARTKPVIWIEAGIHAREWIAPATAIYIINILLKSYGSDSVTRLVEDFDWHILPSANPDGYEYSHTTERLWRKNRSRQSFWCIGVDQNRNFNISFGEKERIKLFLSFHAYSQLLLTPYGFTYTKPSDNAEMMRVAEAGLKSLETTHGRVYTAGSPPDILYPASGGSYDWAKAVAGIKYSYTYEMRPGVASFGLAGFVLPESEIKPNAEEVWASLVTIAREIQY